MRLKKGPPATVAFLFLVGCATAAPKPCDSGQALLNASLWVQTAAEYRASALQTYNAARKMLDTAPTDSPSAVILDLDETALDNSAFESRMVKKGISYDPKDWRAWIGEVQATTVPGAVEFLTYAKSRGVTPFYITNRKTDEEADTRRNLEKLGFPLSATEDTVLTRGERPEWQSTDKSGRRDYVASRYRVLMLLGDDLNDFALAAGKTIEERRQIVESNAALWGTKWFVLPNPMYGSWEKAITGDSPECEALKKKMEALRE